MRSAAAFCLTTIAAAFSVSLQLGNSARSQEMCSSEISSISQDIQERLGAKIIAIAKNGNTSSPFRDAQNELLITLGSVTNTGVTPLESKAGENIINSPSLTKSYSQRIISRCSDIAGVIFGFYEYKIGWALYPDGQVYRLRCVDAGKDYYQWGDTPCV